MGAETTIWDFSKHRHTIVTMGSQITGTGHFRSGVDVVMHGRESWGDYCGAAVFWEYTHTEPSDISVPDRFFGVRFDTEHGAAFVSDDGGGLKLYIKDEPCWIMQLSEALESTASGEYVIDCDTRADVGMKVEVTNDGNGVRHEMVLWDGTGSVRADVLEAEAVAYALVDAKYMYTRGIYTPNIF